MTTGLSRSVQTRLVAHAHRLGVDPSLILARYPAERLLYRLGQSAERDRFVLKGAMLMLAWLGETIRPTRDVDLLGLGEMAPDDIGPIVSDLCSLDVEPDGLVFDASSLQVSPIRTDGAHGGQRAILTARLGDARIRVQVDIGFGDGVAPEPEWLDYPSLLALPRPRLRAYRPETAIAEKLHAMVELGSANSRMKDFFDVHALATRREFRGRTLADAVRATFAARSTPIPDRAPLALQPAFADVEGKGAQWAGFIRRNRLVDAPPELSVVIAMLASFAGPILTHASEGRSFDEAWLPGGPWRAQHD